MGIFDTHLHVIDMERLHYPWLASVEALRRDYHYETYAREARQCGIDGVLHMEVDVDPRDIDVETLMVAGLMGRTSALIKGAISSCRPELDTFAEFLERQVANPVVKGFRRVLHVVPDELSTNFHFRENIARLTGTGLPFDLCVLPHQISKVIPLVDHASGVQFVLDHCGNPPIKDRLWHPWSESITDIAQRSNVAVKISGVSAYGDPERWTVEDLRPFVEHVIGAFGWDRVVWGSDWPVVTLGSSLSTWVAATHALIAGSSDDEKAALWYGNAKRIWQVV